MSPVLAVFLIFTYTSTVTGLSPQLIPKENNTEISVADQFCVVQTCLMQKFLTVTF